MEDTRHRKAHTVQNPFQNPKNSESFGVEIKTCMLNTSDMACEWTWGRKPRRKETCQWNEGIDCVIKVKRKLWKEWNKVGDEEKVLQAKMKAKPAVYAARISAQGQSSNVDEEKKNYWYIWFKF